MNMKLIWRGNYMKVNKLWKLFALSCALAVIVSGCGKNNSNKIDSGSAPEVEQVNDSLKICVLEGDKSAYLEAPLKKYQKKYPEVNIEIQLVDAGKLESERKKLAAELMAGDGADLYLNPSVTLEDVCKAQNSGALEDLMPWFEQVEGFEKTDYLDGTFDMYENTDQCYVFPMSGISSFMAIRKNTAEELGVSPEKWSTASDILDAIEKFYEKYPTDSPFIKMEAFTEFLTGYGFDMDGGMENEKVLDSPELKRDMELYKRQAYPNGVCVTDESSDEWVHDVELLQSGQGNFLGRRLGGTAIKDFVLMGVGSTCELTYEFDEKGERGILGLYELAISHSSRNKENAFHLVETIMEDRYNAAEKLGTTNKKANKQFIEEEKEKWMQDTVMVEGKTYPGLTEEIFEEIEDVYLNGTVYADAPIVRTYENYMKPFLQGEKTYEECTEDFREYMKIYYSE
jgi:ABC-type glycerol-3-phosphate transport system substrate-binding protein